MKRTSRFLALMGGLSLSAEFGKAAALTTVRVSGARAAGGDCGRREASVASSPSPRWLGQPSAVTRLEQRHGTEQGTGPRRCPPPGLPL